MAFDNLRAVAGGELRQLEERLFGIQGLGGAGLLQIEPDQDRLFAEAVRRLVDVKPPENPGATPPRLRGERSTSAPMARRGSYGCS